MKPNRERLETQSNAVHGFSVWLTSTLPRQTDESRDFSDQLLHALNIYEWELDRLIDGDLATQDWYQLVVLTSELVVLLQDELMEVNPNLKAFRPVVEPTTIPEIITRMLSDARTQFAQSQVEMTMYLEQPELPEVLNNFMKSVLEAQGHVKHHSHF
jgi:hypothetical protein